MFLFLAGVVPPSDLLIPATYLGVILVVATLIVAIIVVAILLCFAYFQNQRVSAREKGVFGSAKTAHLGIMNPRVYADKWEVAYQVEQIRNLNQNRKIDKGLNLTIWLLISGLPNYFNLI